MVQDVFVSTAGALVVVVWSKISIHPSNPTFRFDCSIVSQLEPNGAKWGQGGQVGKYKYKTKKTNKKELDIRSRTTCLDRSLQ